MTFYVWCFGPKPMFAWFQDREKRDRFAEAQEQTGLYSSIEVSELDCAAEKQKSIDLICAEKEKHYFYAETALGPLLFSTREALNKYLPSVREDFIVPFKGGAPPVMHTVTGQEYWEMCLTKRFYR